MTSSNTRTWQACSCFMSAAVAQCARLTLAAIAHQPYSNDLRCKRHCTTVENATGLLIE